MTDPASQLIPTLTFQGFGGITLSADAYGSPDQPAVVMLPGGAQTKRSWRDAAINLAAAGRYVLALDLRGHGDSAWAADGRYDLEAFIGDLRAVLGQMPTRPVVVGASIGGLVALATLADGGESLASGLVLVDAAPSMDPQAFQSMGDKLRRHAEGFATVEDAAAAALELSPQRRINDLKAFRGQLRHEADGRYYWQWDPRFLSGGFGIQALAELEPAIARLNLPTLVLHGKDSPLVTEASIQQLRSLLPAAEFADIEGAGHMVVSDQRDAFNAALLEFLERRVPREPLNFEAGSDPRTLRDALGCFGTGIVIATTVAKDGAPVGLTANSFTSVSLDPPLILFCIANNAKSLSAFEESDTFAVNVLHIGQQPASVRFSKPGEDRFGQTPWEQWETGAPIISGSLASIECDCFARHDGGDHVIMIGKVRRARFEPRRDPLLYFRGKYRRLHLV